MINNGIVMCVIRGRCFAVGILVISESPHEELVNCCPVVVMQTFCIVVVVCSGHTVPGCHKTSGDAWGLPKEKVWSQLVFVTTKGFLVSSRILRLL